MDDDLSIPCEHCNSCRKCRQLKFGTSQHIMLIATHFVTTASVFPLQQHGAQQIYCNVGQCSYLQGYCLQEQPTCSYGYNTASLISPNKFKLQHNDYKVHFILYRHVAKLIDRNTILHQYTTMLHFRKIEYTGTN